MNEPIEKLLKQMSLVKPPDSLDQPGGSQSVQPKVLPRTDSGAPSWWMVGVSALACSLAGLLVGISLNGRSHERSASEPNSLLADGSRAVRLETDERNANRVELTDDGFFLLNGVIPVRKYRATTWRKLKTIDADTGQEREIKVPVRQIIVAPSRQT